MTGEARIIRGNALDLPLADESVDLVVTSPPYFALRSYRDGGDHYDGQIGAEPTPEQFVDALIAATREMMRVLRPSGSIFVNLGDKYSQRVALRDSSHQDGMHPDRDGVEKDWKRDKELGRTRMPNQNIVDSSTGRWVREKSLIGVPWRYAIRCIDELGLILRAEIVWAKPNGLPESVTDRVRRSHEQWFHFTKQPRYFSAIDEIREPHAAVSLKRAQPHRANVKAHEDSHTVNMTQACNPLGRLPGSVWTVATEPLKVDPALGVDHFAAFPTEWPRRIILGWSPSAICTVCDEGLRPVVNRTPMEWKPSTRLATHMEQNSDALRPTSGTMLKAATTTITSYACACDTPGPTRPAVVLDPFSGTGTTAGVAKALGRTGIGVDMSADYCRLAEWRTNGPGYDVIERKVHERTYGTTKKKRTPKPDQPDLFGDTTA